LARLPSPLGHLSSGSAGSGSAIFLGEIAPKGIQAVLRPAVQLLAGKPSVVYGLSHGGAGSFDPPG
jgi:ABC-type phosphate transport system permease subunit